MMNFKMMNETMMKYKWTLGLLLLLLPALCGCNNSDDVQRIFTGKTWRLTYISKKNDYKWYAFPGVDETIFQSYNTVGGTRSFKIVFEGNTTDDVINGNFIGSGSVSMSGNWMANGINNQFTTTIANSSVTDSKDTLGPKIINGLMRVTSYSGDDNNLYLYFEYEKETLCLVFAPVK